MAKPSEVSVRLQELEQEEEREREEDWRVWTSNRLDHCQVREASCCALHKDMTVTGKRKDYFPQVFKGKRF